MFRYNKKILKKNTDKSTGEDLHVNVFYLLQAPHRLCRFDHFLKVWQTLSRPSSALHCPPSVCLTVSLPAYILLWLPRPLTLSANVLFTCSPLVQLRHLLSDVDLASKHFTSLSAQAVRHDKAYIQSLSCAVERTFRQPLQLHLNDGKSHFGNLGNFFIFSVNLMRQSWLNYNEVKTV